MKNYKLLNIVTGWTAFAIAAIVYLMTIEPTTSFWDCGEFITTAFRLSVGHPPGAPFFMLLGRIFTLFAGNNTELIPITINALSAIASAFTILFLFWTITHLAKKIVVSKKETPSVTQTISILGAGLVGALAYTFSDTFWFSAVEGEVYGTSSLFTAIVFWAILKWENEAGEKHATRWIIFISYMIGLSIGVHLLNLLAIPAIVFVYYFRQYKTTRNGIIISSIVSLIILGTIMYMLIPGAIKVATLFELLFVNSFGAPYNTGVMIYSALIIAAIIFGIRYTIKKKMVILNTILLATTVILIGYSSYAIIVIRSSANPPMDQNNPDNVFSLLSYLNREQYGDRPLFHGHYYSAPLDKKNPYIDGRANYIKKNDKYVITDYITKPNYDSRFKSFFPRMYSSQSQHIQDYKSWVDIKGIKIKTTDRKGEPQVLVKPTFAENITFFFRYQINWMYIRYFMWNFAGRQNDIQGHGDILRGNWISGINAIDSIRLGDQSNLPSLYANNKGRNRYFFLPFILGLIGMFFQYKSGSKGKKDFSVVALLFILTGIAIVIYLNQYPHQPRERDYAFAGSFYAFAIWIGLGVLGVADLLKKVAPAKVSAIIATAITLFAVPVLMASENWDDHNRAGRKTARDFGSNYLESCAPNAILFTNGDNDTFPLWYAQEVEGIRRDVRVCNLSYLQTDWYIDQMRRKAYDSDPLPINFTHDQYVRGTRDVSYIIDRLKRPLDLNAAINFVRSDDPKTKKFGQNENLSHFPTKKLIYPIDKEAVLKNIELTDKDTARLEKQIEINLSGNYVTKDELMILDMIANNNWERPIYWAITVGSDKYLNLKEYFRTEGFAYRFVPIKTKSSGGQIGGVATDIMYNNILNKFKWGNIDSPDVYLDENNRRMAMNIRNSFIRLSDALIEEGKTDSAIAVLDRCVELLPNERVQYNYFNLLMAKSYYSAAFKDSIETRKNALEAEVNNNTYAINKANEVMRIMLHNYEEELYYYLSLKPKFRKTILEDVKRAMFIVGELGATAERNGQKELAKEIAAKYNDLRKLYSTTMN
jgi:hypothetical protein